METYADEAEHAHPQGVVRDLSPATLVEDRSLVDTTTYKIHQQSDQETVVC